MEANELKRRAQETRKQCLTLIHTAGSGHPGGCLSAADLLTVLFYDGIGMSTESVLDPKRDLFVLSKGHAAPLLYSLIAMCGILSKKQLQTFRQPGSPLQGHPKQNRELGIDMTSGSLGQGLSEGVGMALADRLDHRHRQIYVLVGDGECEEGQIWEAAMAAAHYQLDALCVIVDHNGLQLDGMLSQVMNPCPLKSKWEAFGWNSIEIDGHDIEQIQAAYRQAGKVKGKPTAIIAKTIKGKGVSFMENQVAWHGKTLTDQELKQALKELSE